MSTMVNRVWYHADYGLVICRAQDLAEGSAEIITAEGRISVPAKELSWLDETVLDDISAVWEAQQ